LQVAVIIPEHPISKPDNNFSSDPGRIEKSLILRSLYKLYELSLTPIIFFGKILVNL